MAMYANMCGSYQRSDVHVQLVPDPTHHGTCAVSLACMLLCGSTCALAGCLELVAGTGLHGSPCMPCLQLPCDSVSNSLAFWYQVPFLHNKSAKCFVAISAAGSFTACPAAGTLVTAPWSFAGACRQPLACTAALAAPPLLSQMRAVHSATAKWAACPGSCQSLACIPADEAVVSQLNKGYLYRSPETVAALYEHTLPWYVTYVICIWREH